MMSSSALDSPAASVGMSAATLTVLVLVMRRFLTFLKNNTKNAMVNTYVVPPLVFAAMGGIGFMLRAVLLELWTRIRKRYITTLRMDSKDENYKVVVDYIGEQASFMSSSMLVETHKKKNKTWKDWREEFMMGKQKKASMDYHPDNDGATSVFDYKGKRIWMHRVKTGTEVVGFERTPVDMETLVLTTFGTDNSALCRLVEDAVSNDWNQDEKELNIWIMSSVGWMGGWEKALTKRARPLESVILDQTLMEDLVSDASRFLESGDWYSDRGIPYRRGYILHGPPGNGKTSFCQALAGELKMDICMLTLASKDLTDDKLAAAMRDAPRRSVVMLEDVDAIFVERKAQTEKGGVTFSGLLNAIDGVASQEGRIFIMTTNHIEKLDPALIRPGRCDVQVKLNNASKKQMYELFLRFFPGQDRLAEKFQRRIPENEVSMATLQGHLLKTKDSAQDAVEKASTLLKSNQAKPTERMTTWSHLRRVGLEHYASYLEFFGYHWQDEFQHVKLDDLKERCIEMKYEERDMARMEALLKGEDQITKDYQIADIATMKEMVTKAFTQPEQAESKLQRQLSKSHTQAEEEVSPTLARVNSTHIETPAESAARRISEALSDDGKGLVSIWQLRWLCELYAHSPEQAVERAPLLLTPRSVESRAPAWMSTWTWLQRCGVVDHERQDVAFQLEENGYVFAKDFQYLDKERLKDLEIKGENLETILAILAADKKRAGLLQGFLCPARPRLQREFAIAFPTADASLGHRFAELCSDDQGRGLVSLTMLYAHFARHDGRPEAAIEKVEAEMTRVERVAPTPRPKPPEPGDYVAQWLRHHHLGAYVRNFLGQGFSTKGDLELFSLSDEQLEKSLGVNQLGHRRQILHLLEGGLEEPEVLDELEKRAKLESLQKKLEAAAEGDKEAIQQEIEECREGPGVAV